MEKSKGYEQSDTLDAFKSLSYALTGQADQYFKQKNYAGAAELYEKARQSYMRCCPGHTNSDLARKIMQRYTWARNLASVSP
ncbi:MAG: hypothetical protein GY862_23915 [Gammaproteobacteria bacterium]|nr:hypothetical protein [Gammaproteobacteria bacterium]